MGNRQEVNMATSPILGRRPSHRPPRPHLQHETETFIFQPLTLPFSQLPTSARIQPHQPFLRLIIEVLLN